LRRRLGSDCDMPNIKGAEKRMRQAEKARVKNKAVKTEIKHVRREALSLEAGTAEPEAVYRKYCSVLDKAAKKGVIKKNTAQRRKARAHARLRSALKPAVAAPQPAAEG